MVQVEHAGMSPQDMITKIAQSFRGDPRKIASFERLLVYEESFRALVFNRIKSTHKDPETIARMFQWVDVSCNLALDIISQVAVCYKNGATRTVRDASDEQNAEFRKLYERLCVSSLAQEWNAQAFYLNELVVMPQVLGGRVELFTLLPHMYEPIPDPNNPLRDIGYIYATAHRFNGQEPQLQQSDPRRADTDFVIVDDTAWTTYDGRTGKRIDRTEHNLGYVPAVRLSFSKGFGGGRWANCDRNQRLHDATLSSALISTTLNYIRKAQNRYVMVAIGEGDTDGRDPDTNDPEMGQYIPANPNEVEVKSIAFDTGSRNFVEHIAFIYQSVAQGFGGSVEFKNEGDGAGMLRVSFSYESQREIRDRQLPFAREFERELGGVIIDVMTAAGHPDIIRLPSAKAVRDSLSTDFGKLSRSYANPKDEQADFDFQKSNGATNQLELVRKQEGQHLSDAACEAIIMDNLDKQAKINDAITKRNLPMGASGDVTTSAALNGAEGPKVRDSNKPADAA